MYRVTFACMALQRRNIKATAACLDVLLEAAVQANVRLLVRNPDLMGLRPSRAALGADSWRDAEQIATHGAGDVADIATLCVAQERLRGRPIVARAVVHSDLQRWSIEFIENERTAQAARRTLDQAPFAPIQLTPTITFISSLFSRDESDRSVSDATLSVYLEALTRINVLAMRSHRLPLLYESGVRYKMEPLGQENWQDCLVTLASGLGDCEDLGTWRAAELRVYYHIAAKAVAKYQTTSTGLQVYHILTRYSPDVGLKVLFTPPSHARRLETGSLLEDPSKVLGMQGAFS